MQEVLQKVFTENIKFNPIVDLKTMSIICIVLLVITLIKPSSVFSVIRNILIIGLLFVINLRIMIPNGKTVSLSQNLDVTFVIDTSVSMSGEDYDGTSPRIDGVKKDLKYITSELAGSRFSVITFDDESTKLVPYTYDANIINQSITILETVLPKTAGGSLLTIPISDIQENLSVSAKSDEERAVVVFFISDGELTAKDDLSKYKEIAPLIKGGAVLGYGTKNGGKMKADFSNYPAYYEQYYKKSEYLIDSSTKKDAITKIDEDNLKKIASSLKLDYIHMDKNTSLDNKIAEIKNISKFDFTEGDFEYYEETYYYFVLPLLVLVCIDFLCFKRSIR